MTSPSASTVCFSASSCSCFSLVLVYKHQVSLNNLVSIQPPSFSDREVPDQRLIRVDIHQSQIALDTEQGTNKIRGKSPEVSNDIGLCRELAGNCVQWIMDAACCPPAIDAFGKGASSG